MFLDTRKHAGEGTRRVTLTGVRVVPVWRDYMLRLQTNLLTDAIASYHHTSPDRALPSYGYRTGIKKLLVTYWFLNLSSFLDLSSGVFI